MYKADYQLQRWSGTLAAEVQRLDRTYGTALHQQITEGLSTRQAELVKQAFRHVFFYLLSEAAEVIWEHIENPAAALRLYQFFFRYFSVSLEAFLALNHRLDYLLLRTTIDALEGALGDPDKGIPPSPGDVSAASEPILARPGASAAHTTTGLETPGAAHALFRFPSP